MIATEPPGNKGDTHFKIALLIGLLSLVKFVCLLSLLISYAAKYMFNMTNEHNLVNCQDAIISLHSFLVQLIYVGPDEIYYSIMVFSTY